MRDNGKAIIAVHSWQTTSSLEVYPQQPYWLTLNWTYAYSPLRADWNLWPYEHNHRNYQQFHLRNYQQLKPVPIQFGEVYYDFGAVCNELQINLEELAEGQITAYWYDPCTRGSQTCRRVSYKWKRKIYFFFTC